MAGKKDLQAMIKDALILFCITLISGLVLGFVYELTKEPIRLQKEKAIKEACQEVFADAEVFEAFVYEPSPGLQAELSDAGVSVGQVFEAFDEAGTHLGFVVESITSEGYGGKITLYCGVREDGTLNGISILEISETPGLGMNAQTELVPQFAGKQESHFTYTKTGSQSSAEIDAISGATITTKAVTEAVNGGLKAARELAEAGIGGGTHE